MAIQRTRAEEAVVSALRRVEEGRRLLLIAQLYGMGLEPSDPTHQQVLLTTRWLTADLQRVAQRITELDLYADWERRSQRWCGGDDPADEEGDQ